MPPRHSVGALFGKGQAGQFPCDFSAAIQACFFKPHFPLFRKTQSRFLPAVRRYVFWCGGEMRDIRPLRQTGKGRHKITGGMRCIPPRPPVCEMPPTCFSAQQGRYAGDGRRQFCEGCCVYCPATGHTAQKRRRKTPGQETAVFRFRTGPFTQKTGAADCLSWGLCSAPPKPGRCLSALAHFYCAVAKDGNFLYN